MKEKPVEAAKSSKPSLTGANVSKVARTVLGRKRPDQRAKSLKQDWRAFVQSEFRLTKAQKENLQAIPAREVTKIQKALNEAVDQGGEVQLRLGSQADDAKTTKASGGELKIIKAGASELQRAFTIPIVHCTFDANCRNWKCGVGPAI